MLHRFAAIAALAAILLAGGVWHARAATAAAGCAAARPAVPDFKVTTDASAKVVGQPVAFDWAASATAGKAMTPTYLVLATTQAVRFEGQGFFAIAPGAKGPYDMAYAADRTRAIVPLQFSNTAGTISMLLYLAGEAAVDWAVVQVDPCGEQVTAQRGVIRLDVLPGPPRLIGRDEFASRQPDRIIKPNEGPFQGRVFGGAIEVSDTRNGEVVLQTTGEHPVFSPTGRFLTVETGESQSVDLFDLSAQRRIGRYDNTEGIYWSHRDSFLYVDYGWQGEMSVMRTLHAPGEAIETQPAPPNETLDVIEPATQVDLTALDGGGKDPSANIDPGSGGSSATPGSVAWSVRISIETGLAIFLNTNVFQPDGVDLDYTDGIELGGRIIDLGRARPMIRARDRQELDTVLHDRFGLTNLRFQGWSAESGLWRTYKATVPEDEEDTDDVGSPTAIEDINPEWAAFLRNFVFSQAATQQEQKGRKSVEVASDASQGVLRGAVSMIGATLTRQIPGAEGLGLLDQRSIANLRSGRDNKALKAISAELAKHYDKAVARWQFSIDEPTYDTLPFPDPHPGTEPEEPAVIDLAQEGRDSWTWKVGSQSFWLTQTVASGRRGHSFGFSMLRLRDDTLTRTDVLQDPVANDDGSDGSLFEIGDLRGSLGEAFADPSLVAVAGERYLLVATRPVTRLIVLDLATMKPICRVPAPANDADIERLALTTDAGHLFQFNRDGQVGIYDCSNGERVLTGLFADEELVVMDRKGFFDGSEDAAAYVELKIPGLSGRHVLSQFAGKLRRPGLLQAVLARAVDDRAPLALSPPALTVSTSSALGRGGVELRAQSHNGLRLLELFANGRLALHRELSGRSATVVLEKRELPAAGFITAIVSDHDGLTSAPAEIVLNRKPHRSPGRLIGLAVGVDDYPGLPKSNLKFAAADARRIAAAAGRSKLYAKADVEVLTDRKATAAAILTELDGIVAAAGENDTILLSFATHGLIGRNGRLHLALSETVALDVEGTSLDFDAVVSRLKTAKAKAIVLLDACHAGASGQPGAAANDIAVRQLATGSGSGIVVLAASKGRQFSEESAAIGGGRFSVAVGRILTGRRDASDLDGNGAISVLELYRAVKDDVSAATKGRQIPWIARNQIFGDFDLF